MKSCLRLRLTKRRAGIGTNGSSEQNSCLRRRRGTSRSGVQFGGSQALKTTDGVKGECP